jgi:hypothetical protein
MIINVFNITIRSFVFHVGHWNSTLKTYNQFFPSKIIILIQIFYKWNFMLKNHLYKARGGRGGEGVRIGWEETTSKKNIKKILTPVNIYIYT